MRKDKLVSWLKMSISYAGEEPLRAMLYALLPNSSLDVPQHHDGKNGVAAGRMVFGKTTEMVLSRSRITLSAWKQTMHTTSLSQSSGLPVALMLFAV